MTISEPMPSPSLLEPETLAFADDSSIPNHARLPFRIFPGGTDLAGIPDPEPRIESTLASHDWGEMWRLGAAMGLARGRARVQAADIFGGDVCVLPARTGHHCAWASPDLVVIGTYPPSGKYDLCHDSRAEHARAISAIAEAPMPQTDPVFGRPGPITPLWCP